MSLSKKLRARAAEGKPIRIALIGAGKFGAMFLAQAGRTAGFHVAAIADLAPARAEAALARIGWPRERFARNIGDAVKSGGTWLTNDAATAIAAEEIEVAIDATGHPTSGIRHALLCCTHRKHLVMVNV